MHRKSSLLGLVAFGAAVAAAAVVGARYSPRDTGIRDWYAKLDKPRWNPPDAVFSVVWSALYSLIAVSGWRVWRAPDSARRSAALGLWCAQLTANAGWTRIFFGDRRPKLALGDIFLMEALIVSYLIVAEPVDGAAAACFLPYAGWVGFAAVLNGEIVRLNEAAG